jgi:hypothetical protein
MTRSRKYDPLEPGPVNLVESGPKAAQDRVDLWVWGHSAFLIALSTLARKSGCFETRPAYKRTVRRRRALVMTSTELMLIAALAIIGLSCKPIAG